MRSVRVSVICLVTLLVSQSSFSRQFRESPDWYEYAPGDNRIIKYGDKWVTPNLVGLNIDSQNFEMRAGLEKFKIKKTMWVKRSEKKGTIVSQNPAALSLQDKNFDLTVVVSSGP